MPSVIVATIIFAASTIPGDQIQASGYGQEKYQINAHFVLYMALAGAVYYASQNPKRTVLICFVYALSDEFHQVFTPQRSPQIFDIAVDMVGVIISTLLWSTILPKFRKHKNLPKK